MKHLDLFENFVNESNDTSLQKGLQIIGATAEPDYVILDIKNIAKSDKESLLIVYVPRDKTYRIYGKNKDYDPTEDLFQIELMVGSYGKMKGVPYTECSLSTKSPGMIRTYLDLNILSEKGLSDNAFMWMEEELMEQEEPTIESLINKLINSTKVSDADFKILGIDKNKYRGTQTGINFKV